MLSLNLSAQETEGKQVCDGINVALSQIYGSEEIKQEVAKGFEYLKSLAQEGCLEASYQIAKLYYESSFHYNLSDEERYQKIYEVFKNPNDGFNYVNLAASKGHLYAITLLGQFYRKGYGCKLSYEKAFNYFQNAYSHGDNTAAFLMGYCYYKGLGSVDQDYGKAITWFNKAGNHSMAKHFLAVCNYFGHGIAIDKESALTILENNRELENSTALLEHLKNHEENGIEDLTADFLDKRIKITSEPEDAEERFTVTSTKVVSHIEKYDGEIELSQLTGSWRGVLVDLDYSGEKIMRSFPVTISFSKDVDTGGVSYTIDIQNEIKESVGIILDNSLYFNNLNINFPVLYKDHHKVDQHLYSMLSANIELKEIDFIEYFTAYIDTRNSTLKEPASPKLLVLAKDGMISDNGFQISDELVKRILENQENSFIKLYPNPFESDLLIQYDLTQQTTTTVEIFTLDATYYKKLVDNEVQEKGKKIYHLDGSSLPPGGYVIRVTADGVTHTKVILKN